MSLVALLSASMAVMGTWVLGTLDQRLDDLFERRMVPVRNLKAVSDGFGITVVDTVHHVCAGSRSAAEGRRVVIERLAAIDAQWAIVVGAAPAVTGAVTGEELALLEEARTAAREAVGLMEAGDLAELERFRATRMYPRIEPLTRALERRVGALVIDTDGFIQATRQRLATARTLAFALLVLASVLTVGTGAWVSRRLVSSVTAIESVVTQVAAGNFAARVGLAGTDELAHLAWGIDAMIEELARAHDALATQSGRLARAAHDANAANAAKSLFLSGMSHELRTPLNVILGWAEILQRDPGLRRDGQQAVARIADSGTHLLGLINDVLSISRIEAGTLQARLAPTQVRGLVAAVEGSLAPAAQAKGLALRVTIDPSVPVWVTTDQTKLRQVLVNLVENAIKFTTAGEVHLAVWTEDDALWCSVADTGPGIEPEDAAGLFETFFQGRAGRANVEGTGLGLFLCRSLARLLGGDISCETEPGRGATFRVHVHAPAASPPAASVNETGAKRLAAGVALAPMLVVDDHPNNRELLTRTLSDMGFEVEAAADGDGALARLQTGRFSLCWLDIRMPGLDGNEVVARLRPWETDRGRTRTPVVAITAGVLDLEDSEALARGFDGVVGKPFRIDALVAMIESLLGITLERSAAASAPTLAPGRAPTAAELATLPVAIHGVLRTALASGDTAGALAALADVAASDVAVRLRDLIEGYDFEAVLETLKTMSTGDRE